MEMVREYLEFKGYGKTLANLDKELKAKPVPTAPASTAAGCPKLYKIFESEGLYEEEKETEVELKFKELTRQHGSVLQSARQIFSIAINCLQQLHNIKDGNSMTENLGETIDNYKNQLGKYH